MALAKTWKQEDLRKYDFTVESLPRLNYSDRAVDSLIADGQPVVITNTSLVGPAIEKWSLDYLLENIGDGDFTVYKSANHVFKYFDEKKVAGVSQFDHSMIRKEMKFSKFFDVLRQPRSKPNERYYLQQSLNDTVGPVIVKDFIQFNWKWVTGQQLRNSWGSLTSNLLLISEEGNVTPCHYDEQENFFAQVDGYKRVILFPPSQFECLYTYPIYHPHDRQSQVNFENPDYSRFPKFRQAHGFEAVLGPGDVLYLPSYWFHHFETLLNAGTAISVTFWYKAAPVGQVVYPLKPQQKVAMMRNIEKMLTEALRNNEEVGPFMEAMVCGRYTGNSGL